MDRASLFSSVTCVAPSLIHTQPTQKGWNLSSDIINSQLFDMTQLYAIDGLRPTNAYEAQSEGLIRCAKYFQVVSNLMKQHDSPLLPFIEGKSAFNWTMRGRGKQNLPIPFVCHSSRAELCVATYNLAAAMMQWCVLQFNRVNDDENKLKLCIILMGHAETLLLGLAKLAQLTNVNDISPQDANTALITDPNYLQLWADIAFAQLCELYLVKFSRERTNSRAVQFDITLVDAYDALYLKLLDDNEHLAAVPGFLQRLVAIKRHYYKFHACIQYSAVYADRAPAELIVTASIAAKNTIKSVDKKRGPIERVAPAILGELNEYKDQMVWSDTEASKGEQVAAGGWNYLVYNNVQADVPINSSRHEKCPNKLPETLIDLFGYAEMCAFYCWSVIAHNTIAGRDQHELLYNQWLGLIMGILKQSVSRALDSSPAPLPAVEDPRFPNRQNFVARLRRLGTIFKAMKVIKDQLANEATAANEQNDKIKLLHQTIYAQCVDYSNLIAKIFFRGRAIQLRDITNLSLGVVATNESQVATIDAAIVNWCLVDAETQPYMMKINAIEELLKAELQTIFKLQKQPSTRE